MDVLDRAVWHIQAMFNFIIGLCAGRAFDHLLNSIHIVGRNLLRYHFEGWLDGPIEFEDVVSFFRINSLSAVDIPGETSCVTDTLGLSQKRLAALQIRIEDGVLQ